LEKKIFIYINCEFYRRSFVSNSFGIRAAQIRIRIDLLRIRQKVSDLTGSGSNSRSDFRSVSTTLLKGEWKPIFLKLVIIREKREWKWGERQLFLPIVAEER
jgi:hypothetical protein